MTLRATPAHEPRDAVAIAHLSLAHCLQDGEECLLCQIAREVRVSRAHDRHRPHPRREMLDDLGLGVSVAGRDSIHERRKIG